VIFGLSELIPEATAAALRLGLEPAGAVNR
jgi:hypothetical protein